MSRTRMLRIGELAALCGVNTRTVDYYTRIGLLQPSTRTDGNFRLYEACAVTRLQQVKALQQHRLSLSEIREHLAGDEATRDISALAEVRQDLEEMARKLATLRVAASQDGGPDRVLSRTARSALAHAREVSTYLQGLADPGAAMPP